MFAAAASYGLCVIAFAVLALVWHRRKTTEEASRLEIPAAISAVWALITALTSWFQAGKELAALAELARNLAWLWFLWRGIRALRGHAPASPWLNNLGRAIILLSVAALATHLVGLFQPETRAAYLIYAVFPTLFAIAGMVLVEQFYRNSRIQERWGIKFLCLALGGVFAYDFYLYSQAMLFSAYSPDAWVARGGVNALMVPLIWISTRRRTLDQSPVVISHRMAFHTVALMGTGIYLVMMAAAGYYIRIVGGSWGAMLQTVFLFGAALLLLMVVFSGAARARLRVYLSKHFFRYRYDYREEWLRFTSLLTEGEPGAQVYERSLQAMARLVESPAAALWLRQEDGPFRRVAHWNWSGLDGQVAAGHPFLEFMERRQWVLDLNDCRDQPELLAGAELPDCLQDQEGTWLAVPLLWHERLLGFVVLAESLGRVSFNWEVSDLLKTAARQATAHLAQAQAADALTVARQFESFNRAAAFVVHDIKNLVAQLSLLLANAQKHKHKPEFQEDMLATIESSVARMNRMLIKLSDEPDVNSVGMVDLGEMLHEVIRSKNAFSLKPHLEILAEHPTVRAEREKLLRVIGHLVQNAIEATPYTGRVDVTLSAENGRAVIVVEDNGVGMDAAFIRERLFLPFASTKGTGMGIGAYECKAYVQELGGDIQVTSHPGQGSRFTIRLPLLNTD